MAVLDSFLWTLQPFWRHPELAPLVRGLLVWFALSCSIQGILAIVLTPRWYLIPIVLVPLSGFLLFAYSVWTADSFARQTDAFALFYGIGALVLVWASIAWFVASIIGFCVAKPLYRRARRDAVVAPRS